MTDEQKLYCVRVERQQVAEIYVLADSEEAVKEDIATGLTDALNEGDWDNVWDEDTSFSEVSSSGGNEVWSGGPDGDWVSPVYAP